MSKITYHDKTEDNTLRCLTHDIHVLEALNAAHAKYVEAYNKQCPHLVAAIANQTERVYLDVIFLADDLVALNEGGDE